MVIYDKKQTLYLTNIKYPVKNIDSIIQDLRDTDSISFCRLVSNKLLKIAIERIHTIMANNIDDFYIEQELSDIQELLIVVKENYFI